MKHSQKKKVRDYKKIAVSVSLVKKSTTQTVKSSPFLAWIYTMALYFFFIFRGIIGIVTAGSYNPDWLNRSALFCTDKIVSYSRIANAVSKQPRHIVDTAKDRNVRDI